MTLEADTIVALASAPGLGALALVRLSGPDAMTTVQALTCAEMAQWSARTAHVVRLQKSRGGSTVDQCVVTVFPGPDSYTGEDMVEISTHGGYLTPGLVVEACIEAGARMAEPGEFTRRAYLNGKLDLTQAEAIADLIHGVAPRSREVALHQLERGLAQRIGDVRREIVGVAALLVQHLDFPEEDDAPTPLSGIVAAGRAVVAGLDRLLVTAPAGELLREGALTVLAGQPNSGKSSLFNAFVGSERAIVTEEAGTTRDALEAVVALDGFPFRLVDTAGLREASGTVEKLGIEVAHRYLDKADVVLYCHPVDEALGEGILGFLRDQDAPVILVRTMSDRTKSVVFDHDVPWPSVEISAHTGGGLPALHSCLAELVFGGHVENRGEVPVVTRARHVRLLLEAREEMAQFAGAIEDDVPPEAASAHLKSASTALEEILGAVVLDDVLDRVFRDFCIGK